VANFSIAARTLVHLGAELITSDEVALNELIKNAFDAESARVRIDFRIPVPHLVMELAIEGIVAAKTVPQLGSAIADARKLLEASIEQLAAGPERVDVEARTARLSQAKTNKEAIQILESVNRIVISDTGSGMSKETLEEVFLRIGTAAKLASELSPHLHRKVLGNKGIGRLAMMRLGDRAEVVSWQRAGSAHVIEFDWRDFDVTDRSINDIPIPLKAIETPTASSSGTVITITALKGSWSESLVRGRVVGQFLRRLQNPFAQAAQSGKPDAFPIDVHVNGGLRIPIEGMKQALLEHMQVDLTLSFFPAQAKSATDDVLTTDLTDYRQGRPPVITKRTVDEVTRAITATLVELQHIGPFQATVRWFNRDRLRQQATLHGNWKQAQEELDVWSGGIAIYRDGFRIGFSGDSTGEDWLGLDSAALKRGGFVVNRIQVVGALNISRAENPALVDRSNREGLIETRDTVLVRDLLIRFAIDELRRYIDETGREEKIAALAEVAQSAPLSIRARVIQAEQGLTEIRARVPSEVRKTVQSISGHLQFIKAEVKRFEDATKQAGERREDILELAGVGTVMAGILHELTRTTGNTRQLLQKLAKEESPKTKALLEKLDSEVKAINTRLRQLDPLSPSGRHRKEEFDLSALVTTIVDGYSARFERHQIDCELHVAGQSEVTPVIVKMVRGFVSLAVENLLTNSVYWLQQGVRAGETKRRIEVELDPTSRTLTVRDNGLGIAPGDKDRIFTAGFSLRPRGQGLGLFIAAEVATYHGAKLVLEPPDTDGRYRGFVLELPKD